MIGVVKVEKISVENVTGRILLINSFSCAVLTFILDALWLRNALMKGGERWQPLDFFGVHFANILSKHLSDIALNAYLQYLPWHCKKLNYKKIYISLTFNQITQKLTIQFRSIKIINYIKKMSVLACCEVEPYLGMDPECTRDAVICLTHSPHTNINGVLHNILPLSQFRRTVN